MIQPQQSQKNGPNLREMNRLRLQVNCKAEVNHDFVTTIKKKYFFSMNQYSYLFLIKQWLLMPNIYIYIFC